LPGLKKIQENKKTQEDEKRNFNIPSFLQQPMQEIAQRQSQNRVRADQGPLSEAFSIPPYAPTRDNVKINDKKEESGIKDQGSFTGKKIKTKDGKDHDRSIDQPSFSKGKDDFGQIGSDESKVIFL
jgi:hypothetical protein